MKIKFYVSTDVCGSEVERIFELSKFISEKEWNVFTKEEKEFF